MAVGAALLEVGAGIMLVVGWRARWAAAALFVFTALAALFFHNFWAMPAEQAGNQMVHFMKNVSILGGLLYIVTHGSGPVALRADPELFHAPGDATGRLHRATHP